MKNGEDKNMYRRILVTGATGFVGKNLCCNLKHFFGESVEIIANDRSMCDLRDFESVKHYFNILQPECIIHLAAKCGGIGANKNSPATFMRENLTMGLNVINTSLELNCVKKVVNVGTICAYPKFAPIPFKEEDLWNGYPEETNAPYGIAKKTLTELLIAYHTQYGLNSINLYPTNVFGPHDNFNPETSHVIPAIILKVYNAITKGEKKIELWGDGSPTRDFLYVEDFCDSVILSLYSEPGPHPINIGTNHEVCIKQVAEEICSIMIYDGDVIWNTDYPNGQPRRCVDWTRASKVLGYSPKIGWQKGLRKTIRWFIDNVHRINK